MPGSSNDRCSGQTEFHLNIKLSPILGLSECAPARFHHLRGGAKQTARPLDSDPGPFVARKRPEPQNHRLSELGGSMCLSDVRNEWWGEVTRLRVFESFYTTKPGGLGMGLPICHSIIEAHQGRLWASANLPRGAAFQLTLPALLAGERGQNQDIVGFTSG